MFRYRAGGNTTTGMIFSVVGHLVEITKYITLQPGDVLWMGTEGHADPIEAGDTMDIEITGIETLSNPVVAGAGAAQSA